MTSIGNGFDRKRNGFDLSWPNPWGAFYIDCIALNNYRNWSIETHGVVVRSQSIGGKNKDEFEGKERMKSIKVVVPFKILSTRTRVFEKGS